jgi:uncharacterized protein YigA (DUF484 family)
VRDARQAADEAAALRQRLTELAPVEERLVSLAVCAYSLALSLARLRADIVSQRDHELALADLKQTHSLDLQRAREDKAEEISALQRSHAAALAAAQLAVDDAQAAMGELRDQLASTERDVRVPSVTCCFVVLIGSVSLCVCVACGCESGNDANADSTWVAAGAGSAVAAAI